MVKIYPYCRLTGENFSPNKYEKEQDIVFANKHENGDLGKTGRYKNKIFPYGSASLRPPETLDSDIRIEWLINYLLKNKDVLQNYFVEDIILHFDIEHDNQCNFELDAQLINKISQLNIDLSISCYGLDSNNTPKTSKSTPFSPS